MKIGTREVKVFKIRNRRGYAALSGTCLTEGRTPRQARERMTKALRRAPKR
jgi:hypothetical protein